MLLQRKTVRVAFRLDLASQPQMDAISGEDPYIFKGNDVEIQFGAFYADAVRSLGEMAYVRFDVRAWTKPTGTDTLLATATVPADQINNNLTVETWQDGSAQHGSVVFSGAEMNLDLGTTDPTDFWLVAWGETIHSPPREITLGFCRLKIRDDRAGGTGTAPTPVDSYFDQAACLAMFLPRAEAGSSYRFKGGNFQLYFAEDAKWRSILGAIRDGKPTLTFGPAEDA